MAAKTGRCPGCGNQTPIPEERDDFFCLHCGKRLHVKRANASAAPDAPAGPRLKQFSVSDPSSGMPLAAFSLPDSFRAQGNILPNQSCSVYPIKMTCAAFDPKGTTMMFFTGEGFVDSSKCPLLTGPYSQPVNRVNRVVYRRFMEAASYADDYMRKVAQGSGAGAPRFVEERPLPIEGFDPQRALASYQYQVEKEQRRAGVAPLPAILGWYIQPVCRVYEISLGGRAFRTAIVLLLDAVKYQLKLPAMPAMPDLFGGLFGKKKAAAKQNAGVPDPGSGFAAMPNNAVIEWKSDGVFMLQTAPETFDAAFAGAFRDFCSGFRVAPQFLQQTEQMKDRINQDIAMVTQANIRQQQAQFAAWQQANATRQAAFDAANQAWWARSNATHAANRAAGMSGETSEDRMSRLRSEAIRGVNTYVREDGSETEVSVDYDRAYTNATHDTLATNSAFEPGGNWTEMKRK